MMNLSAQLCRKRFNWPSKRWARHSCPVKDQPWRLLWPKANESLVEVKSVWPVIRSPHSRRRVGSCPAQDIDEWRPSVWGRRIRFTRPMRRGLLRCFQRKKDRSGKTKFLASSEKWFTKSWKRQKIEKSSETFNVQFLLLTRVICSVVKIKYLKNQIGNLQT